MFPLMGFVFIPIGLITLRASRDTPESEFTFVRDEVDGQIAPQDGKPIAPEDYLYMKALYHSLPMQYVTITKLHNMLDGEANQTAVRKLMDRMTQEGYVEASSNRRLGKRVIHSSLTERKLNEVKKVLATDDMDVDVNEAINKTNGLGAKLTAVLHGFLGNDEEVLNL